MNPLKIDPAKCISCGKCVDFCHTGAIVRDGSSYRIIEEFCFECYHCYAVCPMEALILPETEGLAQMNIDKSELEKILFTRRTSRIYKDTPLPAEIINRLIDAACYAPSVVVKRGREFVVITDPEIMNRIKEMTLNFYKTILEFSKNEEFLKHLQMKMPEKFNLINNEELIRRTIILVEKMKKGEDTLFYDAPCLIVVTAGKDSILPQDNCCYALYNMVLLAHSLGIGSCLNGIIINSINFQPDLKNLLKIPDTHKAYAASVFGYPACEIKKIPPRKRENITWL